jgi:uncharacterized RDD family membrane protein YckC
VPRPPTTTRDRLAVAFWTAAVLVYAIVGALYPPVFLLGFWESLPFVLAVTWLAGRLLGRSTRDPGPR